MVVIKRVDCMIMPNTDLFEALCPGQQFFSHFGTSSWVYPVLSNWDEVSCSRTHYRAPGQDRTRDLAIKSPTSNTVKSIIMLTCPCNVHPLTPRFYKVKLGFTLFSYFCSLKHRLWVLVRTASVLTCTYNQCCEQKYENSKNNN